VLSRVFYLGTTGYDGRHANYHIGTVLLMKIIAECCNSDNVDRIDFGLGDAEYKKIYALESQSEVTGFWFAPTLRGIAFNAIHSLFAAADGEAKKILKRCGLLGRIKRYWRARAVRST
jgi:CelD/BcsL family acetyltransferase involved in cellulose biosynthesis